MDIELLPQVETALAALNQNKLRARALTTSAEFGMTTLEFARAKIGFDKNPRAMSDALNWLSMPVGESFPPLLEARAMHLAGQRGKPRSGYLLSEFGMLVLNALNPELETRVLAPRDEHDLQHRFATFDILTRLRKLGWKTEIEKVIRYGNGKELRCDLVAADPNGEILQIEVEQEITSNNAPRAQEKIRRWNAYSVEEGRAARMVIVFNVAEKKFPKTLKIWQQAYWSAAREAPDENLRANIGYLLMGMLDDQPLHRQIEEKVVWLRHTAAPISSEEEAQPLPPPNSSITEKMFADYELYDSEMEELEDLLGVLDKTTDPKERVRVFFRIMRQIYSASYGSSGSQYEKNMLTFSQPPIESLSHLKYYLTLPANRQMYAELQRAFTWLSRQKNMGVVMLRARFSEIIWTEFLSRHGIDRNGNLIVALQAPDFNQLEADFWVEALYRYKNEPHDYSSQAHPFANDEECEHSLAALSWTLSAFFLYPDYLQFYERPWNKSASQRKKQT